MHGKDIMIPKGTEITAYGEIKLDPTKLVKAPVVQVLRDQPSAPQVTGNPLSNRGHNRAEGGRTLRCLVPQRRGTNRQRVGKSEL